MRRSTVEENGPYRKQGVRPDVPADPLEFARWLVEERQKAREAFRTIALMFGLPLALLVFGVLLLLAFGASSWHTM
jgi:hypothetical protein